MGLLSGLGGFGLGNLEGMDLYETPDKPEEVEDVVEEAVPEEAPVEKENNEAEYLFEKSYTCPVCDKAFKALTIRTGKARLVGTDKILRPKYSKVEPLKYDVISCPQCGCTSLTRYWGSVSPTQGKNIRSEISRTFKPIRYVDGIYTDQQAFERYQLALANAIVKPAKPSEKAYICLKTGWLLDAQCEQLGENSSEYAEKKAQADEFLSNALDGLINARMTESFPICGMDESTLDYLIAALSVRFEKYEQAAKLIGNLLVSKTANSRIKDKARDMKEEIISKLR